jgi:pimeloyl-ACP methyl ester carboxylesterase
MTTHPTLDPYVHLPRGRLRVDDGGRRGPAVVFVHGGAANHRQWRSQLEHLRPARRALALDLPGFGESDRPADGDYSLSAAAAAVLAVADARQLGRFVLVGHSYGVGVVCHFAGAYPERLEGLVLVEGYGVPFVVTPEERRQLDEGHRPERYVAFTQAWFEPILRNAAPETRKQVLEDLAATPREVFIASTEGAIGFDPGAAVARYSGPRLAIGAAMLDGPQMFQRAVPGTPFRLIDGVSHWVMLDAPAAVNEALDAFLDELPQPVMS